VVVTPFGPGEEGASGTDRSGAAIFHSAVSPAPDQLQATTFLVGNMSEGEIRDNPFSTVSDGLFWLYQLQSEVPLCGTTDVKLRGSIRARTAHLRITLPGCKPFAYSGCRTSKEDTQ